MPLLDEALKDANKNIKLVQDYFLGLCKERRENPTDDLITALVQAADEGEVLTSDELVSNIIFLFLAGHETTVNLIGNGLLALYNNRDPAIYDEPDKLDITRKNIRPISFGGGVHHCIGAQLARLEGEVALPALLKRLPGLEVDDPENPKWSPSFTLRGLATLPVHG